MLLPSLKMTWLMCCALQFYNLLVLFSGFCRLVPHARSPGTWTIYFEGADYESHLLRESTELASIGRALGGVQTGLYSSRFENVTQTHSLIIVSLVVIGLF